MILYDVGGTFLGMGQNELSALGYEDIEEFKSSYNDFADLFIDQPGYISKFKNFSWIDYILHSGAPNRRVIIKHKDGTSLETELFISEIYLMNTINSFSTLYSVDLGILKTNSQISQKKDENFDTFNDEKDKTDINPQVIEEYKGEDYQEIKEKSTYGVNLDIAEDEIIHIKSTNDVNEIFQENSIDKEDFIEEIKESIEFSNNFIENVKIEENIEYENIDFTQIAEDTGMNLEDIAKFISEFIDESQKYLKDFTQERDKMDIEHIKEAASELRDIADNLNMRHISQTLQIITTSDQKDVIQMKLKQYQKQLENLKEQLF